MPNDLNLLRQRLEQLRDIGPRGALEGLQQKAAEITEVMQQTHAHGDITGATRASYFAAAVGLGQDSAAAASASRAAVELLNPGHSGAGSAQIEGVGMVISSGTDYQPDLETEDAGAKAVLAPTLQAQYQSNTASAAAGSKARLGG